MKLLGNTRELEIVAENCHEQEENYAEDSGIKYPLYEGNYISGLRIIFQQVISSDREKWDKNQQIYLEETGNILSFVGARGAGKTTVMNEFCNILSKMNDKARLTWWLNHTLNENDREPFLKKKFHFYVLKPIDASLLAEKEDLFELILANLYREFETKIQSATYGYNDNASVRRVLNDFSEIATLYRNVIAREASEYESTFISKLQIMKGSQEIKEKIGELIENLLSIEPVADYEYIVIAIDDLDLNLRHGYEMLEQLQKYFSYYKILILVTLDYEQMQLVCEEYFLKAMFKTSVRYRDKEQNRLLANDYMIKVFPLSQRMYMPDIRQISKKSKIKLFPKKIGEIPLEIEVKKFVLLKIAEVMQIYYDACGLKTHFSEPETVRNLVSYNKFLESLEEIDYGKLKIHEEIKGQKEEDENYELLKKYDQNHERFNTDINVRMVQNILNYQQKVAFDTLKQRDLERRARYFVGAKRVENKIVFESIAGKPYSYGDLLGKIHNWGDENAKGDYFLDKPFIRCILASFTSEMICEYVKYRHNPDQKSREKYKTRLLGFLGESFSSEWIGKSFPRVNSSILNAILKSSDSAKQIQSINDEVEDIQYEEMQYSLYQSGIQQQTISFDINLNELASIYKNVINEENLVADEVKNAVENWLDETQIIQILECVDMFFVRREGKNRFQGMVYKFEEHTPDKSAEQTTEVHDNLESGKATYTKTLRVTGQGGNVTLDIMGFVIKSISYKETHENLYNNILNGVDDFLSKYLKVENEQKIRETIQNTIKDRYVKQSLFRDYINTRKKSKRKFEEEIAFPYYNLDMSYNIFKRVRERYKDEKIVEEKVFEKLVEFYKYIGQLLENEELQYKGSDNFRYAQIYRDCPYINILKEWNRPDSKIPHVVQSVFHNMVINPSEV